MRLDKHSSVPLYAQLKEILLERIKLGEYAPGTRIPSELVLCDELDLSRPTVRQAVSELVAEGTLVIVKGRGTFVAAEPERFELQKFNAFTCSFLMIKNLDDIRIDSIKSINSAEDINKLFNSTDASVNTGYWQIDWSLRAKDHVLGCCRSLVPVVMFPELSRDLENGKQMIDIVANKYAYLPQKGSLRMVVRASSELEARMLDISRRSPVISMTSTLTSRSGHACEVIETVFRPDLVAVNFDQGRS